MTDTGAAAGDPDTAGPLSLGIPLGVCQLPRCGQEVPQPSTGRPALYHSPEHKTVADKLRRRYGADALALAAGDPTFDPDAPGPPRLRRPADTTLATFPSDVPEPLAILVEGVRAASQAVPGLVDYLAERSEAGVDARVRQAEASVDQERIRRETAEFEARRAADEAAATVEVARQEVADAVAERVEAEEALERAEIAREEALESSRSAAEQMQDAMVAASQARTAQDHAEEEVRSAVAGRERAEAAHAEASQEVLRVREDLAGLRVELDEQRGLVRAAADRLAEADAARLVSDARLEESGRRAADLEDRLAAALSAADRRVGEVEEGARAERERAVDAQRAITTAVEEERDRLVHQLERVTGQLETTLATGRPSAPPRARS